MLIYNEAKKFALLSQEKHETDKRIEMNGARKEGLEKGLKEGLKEGLKKGKIEERINIAINLLNYGIDKKTISFSTGLSIEEINNLKRGS